MEYIKEISYTQHFDSVFSESQSEPYGEVTIVLTEQGMQKFSDFLQNHIYTNVNDKAMIDYIFKRRFEDFLFSED